ncbi:MAG: hypothetical protein Q9222_003600, partial [Ikaeria aurantiellina]
MGQSFALLRCIATFFLLLISTPGTEAKTSLLPRKHTTGGNRQPRTNTEGASAGTVRFQGSSIIPEHPQSAGNDPPFIPGTLPSKHTIVVATISEKVVSETFVPSTLSKFTTLTGRTTITSTDSFSDPITLIVGKGGVAWVPFSPGPDAIQIPGPSIPPKASGGDRPTKSNDPTQTGRSTGGAQRSNSDPSGPSHPVQTDSGGLVSNTRSDRGPSETQPTDHIRPTGGIETTSRTQPTAGTDSLESFGSGTRGTSGAGVTAKRSTGGSRPSNPESSEPSATGLSRTRLSGGTLPITKPTHSGPLASHPTGSGHTGRDDRTSSGSKPDQSTDAAPSKQTGDDGPSTGPSAGKSNGVGPSNPPPSGTQPTNSEPAKSRPGNTLTDGAQPGNTNSVPGITKPSGRPTNTGNPAPQTTSKPDIFAVPAGSTVLSQSGGAFTYSKETYSDYASLQGTTTITTSAIVTDDDGSSHETSFPVIVGP